MKTKEELNALKEEVEVLNNELAELSEEKLSHAAGGRIRKNCDDFVWDPKQGARPNACTRCVHFKISHGKGICALGHSIYV